jgi:uncharacterized protein (DUF433 family)
MRSAQPSSMNYRDHLTIEPGKRGGKVCVRGMRITVCDVLSYLASGCRIRNCWPISRNCGRLISWRA